MPTSENLSAWIEVDNERLQEYHRRLEVENEQKSVYCWIASEVDKCFEICIHDKDRKFDVGYSITIDGRDVPCGGMISWNSSPSSMSSYPSARVRGCTQGREWVQPFMFSDCVLLGEEAGVDSDVAGNIGEICVNIWRVLWRDETRQERNVTSPLPLSAIRLDERAFKMTEHCAILGPSRRIGQPTGRDPADQASMSTDKVFLERKRVKIVSFIFSYRSLERLRADGIAPTPSFIYPEVIDLTRDSDESASDDDDGARSTTLESLRQELIELKSEAEDFDFKLKRRYVG